MKKTLKEYLTELKNTKYASPTDEEEIRAKAIIDIIEAEKVLETVPPVADQMSANDAANALWNVSFLQYYGLTTPGDVINNLTFNLSENQVNKIKEIYARKILVIHPRSLDPTNPESFLDYENYLMNNYAKIGISPALENITIGSTTLSIRKRYPHEENTITGINIIYNPNDAAAIAATKNYYKSYYENEISSLLTSITPENKDKTDFLALLNELKNKTAYNINTIPDDTIIDNLITELNGDTTDQAVLDGNTTVSIPGTYVMGHQAKKYQIVMKDETYQRIKDKLNQVFGNSAGNNINAVFRPSTVLTVSQIKKRNRYIIEKLKKLIAEYEAKDRSAVENRALPYLKDMLAVLDFDETKYSSSNDFIELIGAYIPKNEAIRIKFFEAAVCLAKPNIDFDFSKHFKHFLPVEMPKDAPTSFDVGKVKEYEEKIKRNYRVAVPETFHEPNTNYKRGRVKLPHEKFAWKNDEPNISEGNYNEYTKYYDAIYQQYVHHRKNKTFIPTVTKAPGKLFRKFLNSTSLTRTLKDIGTAIIINDNIKNENYEEATKRLVGLGNNLKNSAIVALLYTVARSCLTHFSFSYLGPATFIVLGGTIASELICVIKRIYEAYMLLQVAKLNYSSSHNALKEASEYLRKISTLDPTTDADEIAIYKRLIRAHVGFYISHYNSFEETYDKNKNNEYVKREFEDNKTALEAEYSTYKALFVDYWDDGEKLAPNYRDLSAEDFDKILEAIKKGQELVTEGFTM